MKVSHSRNDGQEVPTKNMTLNKIVRHRDRIVGKENQTTSVIQVMISTQISIV